MVESKITRDFTAQCSLFTYTKIQTIMLIYKHGLLIMIMLYTKEYRHISYICNLSITIQNKTLAKIHI